MATASACASTSLAGQALGQSRTALAGKVNIGEARVSMKATATDNICYGADRQKDLVPFSGATPSYLSSEYPGDCDWNTAGLSSDPEICAENRCAGTVKCWQLTMGRLSRSGNIYSYERTKDGGYARVQPSDINVSNNSYQRLQQHKGDKEIHHRTERNPRPPEFNRRMASNTNSIRSASEALAVLKSRLHRGITLQSYTYVNVLRRCSEQKDLLAAKQVHEFIIESRMDKNPYVATALLNAYIKCGKLLDARRVFDEIEEKDVVTWNVMIVGYAKSKHACGHEAYRLYLQMRQEGFEPDAITYTSVLNASASVGPLEWVKEVHGHASKAGLDSNLRVGNALVHMYAKSGSIDDARLVFDRMEKRSVVTWNVMIGGLAQHGRGHEAYRLFLKMRLDGFEPNAITYMNILNGSASAGALEWVNEVHGHARKAGLELDVRVGSALIHMYAKSGSIEDARQEFNRLEKRDVVTWNAMIGGLAEHGCGHEALELFSKLNAYGVKPDGISFVAVLSACCHAGLLDDGRRLFLAMTQEHGIEPDVVHLNCMVDLLGRSGHVEEAIILIRDIPVEANGVTWGALLGACRTYGKVELGELAANELLKLEPDNASAYVLLSNIYAAAGKWGNVSVVRTLMQKRGVRKEPGRSWIEFDNKIHEFVVGDTSHPEATAIYAYINKLTEELKAEGYIPDTKLVLQKIDDEDKELALCSHSEKLAIAYGLMHIPQGKPIRVQKNLRVCSDCHTATKFISKVTGREIIARDANRFHHFKDGGCSCGDYW